MQFTERNFYNFYFHWHEKFSSRNLEHFFSGTAIISSLATRRSAKAQLEYL